MSEDIKEATLAAMEKSAAKGKKRLNMKDLTKLVPEFPKNDVKKAIQDLIAEEKLAYWSSGSSTYIMTKADFETYKSDMED